MSTAANVVVAAVAHCMSTSWCWRCSCGTSRRACAPSARSKQAATATKVLAANQGLYNGFLAAGLFWGLSQGEAGRDIKVFFLGCVLVAGLYGAATASRKILFVQALPAAAGLALLFLA